MVSTDYLDYYTNQIHKFLIDNNASDKVMVRYWSSDMASGKGNNADT